ncbi:hypothetical protein [Viridibacillus arvi]|uniref:hypothetical protein n=1 Tax=Viridibacillus arvi TaxID=263475 RepID=UPI003CFCB696
MKRDWDINSFSSSEKSRMHDAISIFAFDYYNMWWRIILVPHIFLSLRPLIRDQYRFQLSIFHEQKIDET